MFLVIPINGVLKRYEDCKTDAEREDWLTKYDKLMQEAEEAEEL